MFDYTPPALDAARMRREGKAQLSLALMDARNHTLRWSHAFEAADDAPSGAGPNRVEAHGLDPHDWLLGHIGWFQEQAVSRNVQRQRGRGADASAPRLASIDPAADGLYDPALVRPGQRERLLLPSLESTRQYLIDTLEITLDLLERSEEDDASLHFFRLALFHEDLRSESFAMLAQAVGLEAERDGGLVTPMANTSPREPLDFGATRWRLGSDGHGFAFDNELPAHEVSVPDFEIDAQPVSWAQFGEFVEDGGYDDPQWWSPDGRAWLGDSGRRCPLHVDQMRHGVLQLRFGRLTRVPLHQPVLHVSWYEAEAWCRWAGRRLPTEVEWELAVAEGAARGLRWGQVREWTAARYHGYPGHVRSGWEDLLETPPGASGLEAEPPRVIRGASFATRERVRHVKQRQCQAPRADQAFTGFRTCAI